MRLLSPYAVVTLGDLTWRWGDGRLSDVQVMLSEGEKASSCSFSIYDPGRVIIDKLLEFVEKIEGLEPLEVPEKEPAATGAITGTGTASGDLSANMRAMLDTIGHVEVGESGGYDTLFGGGKFSDFSKHPGQSETEPAGRYQFQLRTWREVAGQEGLTDFTPQAQDIGAVNRIISRGAADAVEAGDIASALDELSFEWAALPASNGQFRYAGQGSATVSEVTAFFNARVKAYAPGAQTQSAASESVKEVTDEPPEDSLRAEALAGAQITLGFGFDGEVLAQWSFLSTSISYKLYDRDRVDIQGQVGAWIMTQRVKTTAYIDLTLKQLATKICSAYGLVLAMEEDGPFYEYFPQRGVSDYEALLIECRRIGYRLTSYGNTVTIKARGEVEAFVLARGENLGADFSLTHVAQGQSSGGARSSDPSIRTTTGQRKVIVNPDTGKQELIRSENVVGAGQSSEEFTTGAQHIVPAPRTDGKTDAVDQARKNNETRVKGIEVSWSAPTTPELLLVDPDSAIQTQGFSPTIDRVWVVESITHSLDSSGFSAKGSLYSPMRNKYPSPPPAPPTLSTHNSPDAGSNPTGFIKPMNGVLTSGFGQRSGRLHAGVDLAAPIGTEIWAAADGVASVPPFDTNGYGNWVLITHPGGTVTRYGHMSRIKVGDGQSVKQGDVIGLCGSTGSSTGPHLHWEVRPGDSPQDPAQFVRL